MERFDSDYKRRTSKIQAKLFTHPVWGLSRVCGTTDMHMHVSGFACVDVSNVQFDYRRSEGFFFHIF